MSRKLLSLTALGAASLMALTACSGGTASSSQSSTSAAASSSSSAPSSITIESDQGNVEVKLPVQRVASLDNRTFEVLEQWNVPLVAAPKKLIPSTVKAYNTDSVADIGMHRDPNLEALAASNPGLPNLTLSPTRPDSIVIEFHSI